MDWTSRRNILLAAMGLILLVLTARLVQLQLIEVGKYRRIANENRIRVLPISAPRGRILDRNGRELVSNRSSFTVAALPGELPGPETRLRLAAALGIGAEDLNIRLQRRPALPLEPVGILRDADLSTVARIEERLEEFPGVIITNEPIRQYPSAPWGGHLLGYVREVGEEDSARTDRSGTPVRGLVGATGLERRYDDVLRGLDGVAYRQVNAFGQVLGAMPGYDPVPPTPGDDLMLAVDLRLQEVADSCLREYVAGTAVAMDVRTGEILCYVTRPGFDANAFAGVLTAAGWAALRDDPLRPMLNRAVMGIYPPGSTTKVLTAAAGMQSGSVTSSSHLSSCGGGYRFGNRVFKCWRPEGHGSLDLVGAIEQSCDVYFYQLGARISLGTWSRYAREAGFGKPTGIDLPSEAGGTAPSPAYYDRLYGKGKWTSILVVNLAIGQGEFAVTPLQLLVYFAAIANDGQGMRPRLVRARRPPGGDWVYTRPEESFDLGYSAATLAVLREGCRRVVEGGAGTAHAINDDKVRMAGKTGTAQNPHGDEHAWFVGYAPAENPRIAVVALVENAGHGSTHAAPVCYQIAKAFLVPPVAVDSVAAVMPQPARVP